MIPITKEEIELVRDYIEQGFSIKKTCTLMKENNYPSYPSRIKQIISDNNIEYKFKKEEQYYFRKQLSYRQKSQIIKYCREHNWNVYCLTYPQINQLYNVFEYDGIIDGLLYCLRNHKEFNIQNF